MSEQAPEPTAEPTPKKKEKTPPKVKAGQVFDGDAVIPFTVKKSGIRRHYCIGEMSGMARDTYLAEIKKISKVTTGADGKPFVEMTDFRGMSTMLLKHCIYGYDPAAQCSDQQQVPEDTIASWPTSMLDALVATANDVNSLGEDSSDKAGND